MSVPQGKALHRTLPAVTGVFLAIEGPIGAGKTTLAGLIRDAWQAELVREHFDENPFLPLFYADRERYAWQTQLHFLIERFDQWSELGSASAMLVGDYLFDKDRVFAELNLTGDALRRYLKVYHALRSQLRQPSGVIYLYASLDVLHERIRTRARPYEQQIEREYLAALSHSYQRFFASYTDAPVLALDMTERDLLHNPGHRAAVFDAMQAAFGLPPIERS